MKHLKTYESHSKSDLDFTDLNSDTRMDIISNIYHNNEYLMDNWNIWTFRDYVEDFIGLPKFRINYKNVDELYEQLLEMNWVISDAQLNKLLELLENGVELDPIIVDDGKFFDGGHRLTAYKKVGKKEIPTIDIIDFKSIDWKEWLEG